MSYGAQGSKHVEFMNGVYKLTDDLKCYWIHILA